MLSNFSKVVIFSKGMMNHRAINSFWGDKLCSASEKHDRETCFLGWGNKPNTKKALRAALQNEVPYFRLEDGFIRSVGLGVQGAASFSLVTDDLGIYYDATKPSRLEEILSGHDFSADRELEQKAEQAIDLLIRFKISKYNTTDTLPDGIIAVNDRKKILVVAQTAGDMSLEYGHGYQFSTSHIIDAAFWENPGAEVYLKIHPDVIAGKKKSDFDLAHIPKNCRVITQDVNPIHLLEEVEKVYTKTSQMGFEALLLGKKCVCFGMPFYAGWGLTDDRVTCPRRNRKLTVNQLFAGAYILYCRYYNPFLDKETDIIDTLYTIKRHREIEIANRSTLLFHGFSYWKRLHHRHFFQSYEKNDLIFCSSPQKIEGLAKKKNAKLFIWSKPENPELDTVIDSNCIDTYHVEDGFIRSVSLGSDLTRPYSLVVDSRGLYIDPSRESDLEYIYNTYDFKAHTGLLERAEKIADAIVQGKLSKYNCTPHGGLDVDASNHNKIILIPGQVDDDASIRLGGFGMTNASLIELVRKNNPGSYILYKPHPDVVAGNREGKIPDTVVLKYCDQLVSDISIDTCISLVDEVHTITSLCGFDALLRGKKVATYGIPFYAGWGLTEDSHICERRRRSLSKNELVAGALLLYPRYIHPITNEFCEIEQVLEGIRKEQARYDTSIAYRQIKKIRNQTITTSRKMISRFT
ncbi:MAG: hypothetical protein WBB19_00820 [Desulforhopalus sp.]